MFREADIAADRDPARDWMLKLFDMTMTAYKIIECSHCAFPTTPDHMDIVSAEHRAELFALVSRCLSLFLAIVSHRTVASDRC